LTDLLRQLHQTTQSLVSESQMQRLRQINLQRRLPLAFKSSEVIHGLELTVDQVELIDQVITKNMPDRGPRGRKGPGDREHDRERPFGTPGREGPGMGGPPRFGSRGGPRGGDPFKESSAETIRQIVQLLTPEQRSVWVEMIGPTFQPPRPGG
ncbi:MAG: hypothetical protein AAGJ83_07675, partial [Planctomycetota bacterium]